MQSLRADRHFSAHSHRAALHLPCHAGLAEQTTLASKRHLTPQFGSEFCKCLRGWSQSMASAPCFGRHQLMRLQTVFVIAFAKSVRLPTFSYDCSHNVKQIFR